MCESDTLDLKYRLNGDSFNKRNQNVIRPDAQRVIEETDWWIQQQGSGYFYIEAIIDTKKIYAAITEADLIYG